MEAIISAVVLPSPEAPPVITAALPSRSMFNLHRLSTRTNSVLWARTIGEATETRDAMPCARA